MMNYIEPKICNKYNVYFPKGLEMLTNFVSTIDPLIHEKIKNEWRWRPLTVTFVDPINPSVSQKLIKFINNNDLNDNFIIKLYLLDPLGCVIEKWKITTLINEIRLGKLDYASSELHMPSMTLDIIEVKLEY